MHPPPPPRCFAPSRLHGPPLLSLWGWQDVIKAVFTNKVTVVATYGNKSIRSARMEVQLPSVIALNVGAMLAISCC